MGKGQVLDIGVVSADVAKQMQTLKLFPEIVERYYHATMNYAVVVLEGIIRPRIPVKSGKSVAAFGSKVMGKGMSLKGEVGFVGKGKQSPYWIRIVNAGASAHVIVRDQAKAIRFKGIDGSTVFTQRINHPGFGGQHFMEAGQEEAEPRIEGLFEAANGMVIKELAG